MLDNLLMRFHGLFDWGLVFLAVFALVFFCQGLVTFFKDSNGSRARKETGKEVPRHQK